LAQLGVAGRLSLLVRPGELPPELAELGGYRHVELVSVGATVRAAADQWALPGLLRRLRPHVYHAPYYAIPAFVPGRIVVTIHDLIPRLFPHYWPNPVTRAVINGWTAYAAYRSARVIAPSHTTAGDVARLLPGTAGKVRVALEGATPRPAARPAAAAERGTPYLLYVGSNKPHKNLPRLVAAFARVSPGVAGNLVIAGAWDERYPRAAEIARRRGITERVIFERRPSDARLDELYAAATGFIFPSLYEGFGLPVLEAMAAGLPVATTDRGSLAEVAGEAALRFDPHDEAAIAAAIQRLLSDEELRAQLSARGRAQAALFPWSRTAEEIWAVYEEAASA
jgi:alpha-1,3-rhamnosyl/mannosyltransferase